MREEGTQTELRNAETSTDNKQLKITRRAMSKDPYSVDRKHSFCKHPLWAICVNNIWKILLNHEIERDNMIGYNVYRDFRLVLFKSIKSEQINEDCLVDIWDDWTKVTSLLTRRMTFDAFNRHLIHTIEKEYGRNSIIMYLFVINSVCLNVSENQSLKSVEKTTQVPSIFFGIINKMKGNSVDNDWSHFSDIKLHVSDLLELVFPNDRRIATLWKSDLNGLLKCLGNLDENHQKRYKVNIPRHHSRKIYPDRVKLPILGKAYQFSTPCKSGKLIKTKSRIIKTFMQRNPSSKLPPKVELFIKDQHY